jgi:nucleotide-binding universal stress UspA family protein
MANSIQKVMVATDGSRPAQKAIDFALGMKGAFPDAKLTFLLATRLPEASASEIASMGADVLDAAAIQDDMELAAAQKAANEAGVKNARFVKVPAGRNIAAAIVNYADKEKIDHIIMGSTGLTGVARMLLGSVASEVVAKAPCPVTVVR